MIQIPAQRLPTVHHLAGAGVVSVTGSSPVSELAYFNMTDTDHDGLDKSLSLALCYVLYTKGLPFP